jgi:hypothetical protein
MHDGPALESTELWGMGGGARDLAMQLWADGWRPQLAPTLTAGQRVLHSLQMFEVLFEDRQTARVLDTPEARDDYGRLWVPTTVGVIETDSEQEVWARD